MRYKIFGIFVKYLVIFILKNLEVRPKYYKSHMIFFYFLFKGLNSQMRSQDFAPSPATQKRKNPPFQYKNTYDLFLYPTWKFFKSSNKNNKKFYAWFLVFFLHRRLLKKNMKRYLEKKSTHVKMSFYFNVNSGGKPVNRSGGKILARPWDIHCFSEISSKLDPISKKAVLLQLSKS